VVRQELETRGLDMCLETVQLDAVAVVYEDIFFLRDGKVGVVVQKPGRNIKIRIAREGRTHVMSRHVSCSCNSAWSVPVCQSNVDAWPMLPTIARCLYLSER
jgi:hypothetical protein